MFNIPLFNDSIYITPLYTKAANWYLTELSITRDTVYFWATDSNIYKYDTTTIKEIEFFIEKNTKSKFCKDLLYTVVSIYHENKWGVEKTLEYMNYLKEKFQNETLNKNIDEVCEKDDYLNKR